MNKRQVKERLSEFAGICQHAENDGIVLLEAALFVEDVFGIALSDNEICKKNLGTHNAIEKFIVKKLQL
jgi:acyl carrier protein